MKLDELTQRRWHRLQPAQRAAFFACIITGYLVHLYAFTNIVPCSDGLSRVYDPQQMTVSGRWFLHYASMLNGFTQMPAVIGLLSMLLLGAAAALTVGLLHVRSRSLGGVCGAVMAAFPCLGYTFLYMFTASAYCLAIFMAVLAVQLAVRGKGWFVPAVLLLAMAMGTYQAYAAMSIALSVLVVIEFLTRPEATLRGTLRLGGRLVAFLALGAAAYYGILQIFLRVKHVQLLSYLGMDTVMTHYPLAKLPSLLVTTYKQVLAFFFIPGSVNGYDTPVLSVLNALLLAAAAVSLVAALRHDRLLRQPWRVLLLLILILLFPLAINFGQIMSPYSAPTPIMKYAFVLVYLAALLMLDKCDGCIPRPKAAGIAGAVCVCALLVCFLQTNNLLYTASAQAHRATQSYLTRMMARVEDCDGYTPGMEVVIIGTIPDAQMHSAIESYAQVSHYSVPIHQVAPLNKHLYYYLNDWLSIPIEEPSQETMAAVAGSDAFAAMPLYPQQGSVQVIDGRLVVKLSEQYTPKSDFEIAFENRR